MARDNLVDWIATPSDLPFTSARFTAHFFSAAYSDLLFGLVGQLVTCNDSVDSWHRSTTLQDIGMTISV